MGQITADQSQQVMAILATNVDWSTIDFEGLGLQDAIMRDSKRAGAQFEAFLKNRARLIIGGPQILSIDRSDPAKFIGPVCSIWRGLSDGNGLKGVEEQDQRSLALTEIPLANLRFESMLKGEEIAITGEEKLGRHMAAGHIRLDARVAQALYQEPGQITLRWFYENFKVTWMEFPGTVLRDSGGRRCFLCLYRSDGGSWRWRCFWLDYGRIARYVSAVLVSTQTSVA